MTPDEVGQLYETTHPTLTAYFSARLAPAHRHLAEDFASDVFVRALRSCDTYQDRGAPVEAWLYAIARNLLTDHGRRVQRQPVASLERCSTAPADATAERALMHADDVTVVAGALAGLTTEQRRVVTLAYWHGYREPEIAAIMGCSGDSVKQRRKRAHARLGKLMGAA